MTEEIKYCTVVYSPYDEEETGKGWYISPLWPITDEHDYDLYSTEAECLKGVRDKGLTVLENDDE